MAISIHFNAFLCLLEPVEHSHVTDTLCIAFKEEWEVTLFNEKNTMMWFFFQVLISWPNLIRRGGMITTHDNYTAYITFYSYSVKKNFYPYSVIIKLYFAVKIGRRNHLQICLIKRPIKLFSYVPFTDD